MPRKRQHLRHTFCSRLIMYGADLKTAQTLMGRKTISMTARCPHLLAIAATSACCGRLRSCSPRLTICGRRMRKISGI
jgi:hypothetical protein